MTDHFKQPILLFGLVLPLLLMFAICGGALYFSGSTGEKYTARKTAFNSDQLAIKQNTGLMKQINQNKRNYERWQRMLGNETRASFMRHLETARSKFPPRELVKTSHSWENKGTGLGSNAKQPASQINLSFNGTFRAMQAAMLEMETRLPQMQLESLSIQPADDGKKLNFKTTHTVWTLD